MASFLALKKVGYGTDSLLEQWREIYENVDYNYDHTMMICGGKKKKSNNNALFGSRLYCSTSLVDVTCTIRVGTSSNGGNGDVNDGTVSSVYVDSGNVVKEVVSPIAIYKTMKKERPSPLMETTDVRSYLPLPTQGTTIAGTTPGKSLYANVTCKPSGKKVNFHTLFTPGGNGIDVHPDVNLLKEDVGTVHVWVKLHGVPVVAFSEDGLSAIATKLAMPKITKEGYYTCNIHVECEWKPPRYACYKVFGHVQEEHPKNIDTDATKNLKKTSQNSQTPKGIPVGHKMGFKPKHVFQPVSKKSPA
nr:hypothetical protein [Tanacetum cinerariifolium]